MSFTHKVYAVEQLAWLLDINWEEEVTKRSKRMISGILYIVVILVFVLLCLIPIYLIGCYFYALYKDLKNYNARLKDQKNFERL